LKSYNADTILRDIIDKHNHTTTFNDTWDCAPSRFEKLRSFCDEPTTVLANTTSVEFDFSILKWEMDVNRMALMHLSLEGIFQAKQCLILQTQSEIKYNTMRRLKTKLILLDFRYPKTYEA
jgi:hypothetical protein